MKNETDFEAMKKLKKLQDNMNCFVYLPDTSSIIKNPVIEILEYTMNEFDADQELDINSDKVWKLRTYLDSVKLKYEAKDLRCVIFVTKRADAKALSEIIKSIEELKDYITCEYIIGIGTTEVDTKLKMNHNEQAHAFKSFRDGKINLLVATNVVEEGIDISKCNVVIRFDMVKTLTSNIQSRGRARDVNSHYVLMINLFNPEHTQMVAKLEKQEEIMRVTCINSNYTPEVGSIEQDEMYQVESTGAKATLLSSLAMLNHYCDCLPVDIYSKRSPKYTLFYSDEKTQVHIYHLQMPINSPLQGVFESNPKSNIKTAKASAALMVIQRLHQMGELDDHLLPVTNHRSTEFDVESLQLPQNSVNEYKQKIPTCFTQTTHTSQTLVYIYCIVIDSQRLTIGFASKNLLPPIQPFTMYFEPTKASTVQFVKLSRKKVPSEDLLKQYNQLLWSILLGNKKTTNLEPSSVFYIVPLQDKSIDVGAFSNFHPNPLHIDQIEHKVIYGRHTARFYKPVNVRSDLNPLSADDKGSFAEQYRVKYKKQIKDTKQSLVEAVEIKKHRTNYFKPREPASDTGTVSYKVLIPECHLELPENLYNQISLLPSLLWKLESCLLEHELQVMIAIQPSDELISQLHSATLTKSAQAETNYERLEFLGDSFIKYITSVCLYLKFPLKHEGWLSLRKNSLVSNNKFLDLMLRSKIIEYIRCTSYNLRNFSPPGYEQGRMNTLSNKTVADVLEAITGAYYHTCGQEQAIQFLRWIGSNIPFESLTEPRQANPYRSVTDTRLNNLRQLEIMLNYRFNDVLLLDEALTHASIAQSPNCPVGAKCYQRLEFIGDAILDLLVVQDLYKRFSNATPGKLTDMKIAAVNNGSFAYLAVKNEFHHYLQKNEENQFITDDIVKFVNCTTRWNPVDDEEGAPKLLGDIFEAVAGAIYLDSNLSIETVRTVYEPLWREFFDRFITPERVRVHPIRELQEMVQEFGCQEANMVITNADNGQFDATYTIHDNTICSAQANSKSAARKACAKNALQHIKHENYLETLCDCTRK
jgi:endoribonuclease Dicer